ncbi:MAG: DUF3592 domain-containing protein [bacterium]|nr:DUF3592 domain-containing protein [bacterium]
MSEAKVRRGCGCGLVWMVVTIGFLVVAGLWSFASFNRVNNQDTASGIVVDVDASRDSDGDTTYRPVIEFLATDGETYRFTGRLGTSSYPDPGSRIDVLYDPADPRGATEKTFPNLWLFPIIFGAIGIISLLFLLFSRAKGISFGSTGTSSSPRGAAPGGYFDPFEAVPTAKAEPAGPGQRPADSTVEFRRAEAAFDEESNIRYRIVAKDEAGQEFYSELLDEDPTVAIMQRGNRLPLIERDGLWIVDFDPEGG